MTTPATTKDDQAPAASTPDPAPESPLQAFTGDIHPARVAMLYKGGLAIVALAMVLLPTIYLALILLTVWAVCYHLGHDTWIMSGSGHGVGKLILYLGPAVVGGTLVAFMVKPFFARVPKAREPVSLDPGKEPMLFAFIERICRLVRAASPCRVDVDCQVNASASLRHGLLSNDLVLTIGLPLAGGLDMRQFAGVLAHEFGHFAQGTGLRLTYVVRRINLWFARVVYERDGWDLTLERSAKSVDFRIGVVLHAARGCVWLTRRLLWALMHAGHAISCFMLRQMEYDADSYEAKVAGSDAFESTALQLQALNIATQAAYEEVRQSWASKRLPEDLPLLIRHKAAGLPAEVGDKLRQAAAARKTGVFDTHPCDADRIQASRQLGEPGVFRLTQPAAGLFSNFEQLSKAVTRHHYEHDLEIEFTDQNLVSSEQALQESAAHARAEEAIRKFFGVIDLSLSPLFGSGAVLPPLLDASATLDEWRQAREQAGLLRPAAEASSKGCSVSRQQLSNFTSAQYLLETGFTVNITEFDLPETATSNGEQQNVVEQRLKEISACLAQRSAELGPFLASARTRLISALQLLQSPEVASRLDQAAAYWTEAQSLVVLLSTLGQALPSLHSMNVQFQALNLLLQNRGNHSKPEMVDGQISSLTTELRRSVKQLQAMLSELPYPFPHARGPLTVADYARSEKPSQHELEAVFHDTGAHLERLFTLHYQALGRLLVIAETVEDRIQNNG